MRVSIVVPVKNRVALTDQTLGWLEETVVRSGGAELVVVDDGSTDETARLLADSPGELRAVRNEEPGGFAAACNVGAANARGDVLVFLNNDMAPVDGWLDMLLDYLSEHDDVAAAGSKLLDSQGRIQHAGIVICHDGLPRHAYRGFPRHHPAVEYSRAVRAVTGACLAIRREIFESLGGFDEAFLNGFEDVDLCLRLAERGGEIHYCHASELHHFESSTRVGDAESKARDLQNIELFLDRWRDRVAPNDLTTYVADGLISIDYSDVFPLSMRLSAELAVPELDGLEAELGELLGVRSRQVFDLLKENVTLRVQLGELEFERAAPDWLLDAEPRGPFNAS